MGSESNLPTKMELHENNLPTKMELCVKLWCSDSPEEQAACRRFLDLGLYRESDNPQDDHSYFIAQGCRKYEGRSPEAKWIQENVIGDIHPIESVK
jgi:hypothetical protein